MSTATFLAQHANPQLRADERFAELCFPVEEFSVDIYVERMQPVNGSGQPLPGLTRTLELEVRVRRHSLVLAQQREARIATLSEQETPAAWLPARFAENRFDILINRLLTQVRKEQRAHRRALAAL